MLLVLCGLDDTSALWFARRATQSGADCTIVTTEALSFARQFSHRLDGGAVRTAVRLADGTSLTDHDIGGVLNRAVQPPTAAWQLAAPAERDYAAMELHACTLSWLHALPGPVRNRPEPDCLAGPLRHPFVTVAAAHAAGLPCPQVSFGTAGAGRGESLDPAEALLLASARAAGPRARPVHLVCLDGVVLGCQPPEPVAAAITAFAVRIGAGAALLGLDFLAGPDGWWFAGTSPLPDLRAGGDALVQALLTRLAPAQVAPPAQVAQPAQVAPPAQVAAPVPS
jgi:hypothetical protein